MAATYCVVAIFESEAGETEGERKRERGPEKERKRYTPCPFSCTVKVDVPFFSAPTLARCFMAIVCARQMAQKRDRMLPLGEPSRLKYDRGANGRYGSILYK